MPCWWRLEVHGARVYTGITLDTSCAHTLYMHLRQYVCGPWLAMWLRATLTEERAMAKGKETVYYYTFIN